MDSMGMAVMSDTDPPLVNYTVNFVNNSLNSGTVYLYQTDPTLSTPPASSLAWLAYGTNPGVINTILWSTQYSMFWSSTTTPLNPGTVVTASQNLPCGLSTNNEVTFTKNAFGYRFQNQTTGSPAGSIIIFQDSTIPADSAYIGIGMAGAGSFAIMAQPNITTLFTPDPTYWVAFSLTQVQQGTVLVTQSTNSAKITFPSNTYTCTATLDKNNTWSLRYS